MLKALGLIPALYKWGLFTHLLFQHLRGEAKNDQKFRIVFGQPGVLVTCLAARHNTLHTQVRLEGLFWLSVRGDEEDMAAGAGGCWSHGTQGKKNGATNAGAHPVPYILSVHSRTQA